MSKRQSMVEVFEALLAEVRSLRKVVEGVKRPLLLTQAAVALELSLSARTVKRMISRGELPTVRAPLCRRSLVAASDVDRWIAEHIVRPDNRQKKRGKSEADKIRALAKG